MMKYFPFFNNRVDISLSLPLRHSLPSSPSLPRHPNPNPRYLLLSFRSESHSLNTNPSVPFHSLLLPFHTPPSPPPLPNTTSSRHSHSAALILHPPTLPSCLLPIHSTPSPLHPPSTPLALVSEASSLVLSSMSPSDSQLQRTCIAGNRKSVELP
ncbi:hypothetical protein BLNAU_9751 [Blattamonas nauphoetae]|uniref:Uncharacterized protein n=1 Tax=Blattamonas nauphoetae TaxID=2049346 RepID=A0ABQ9XV50_9EUKA|nr:hypothetical protein BLNAU_9751 [Blattamonas nauphoetae]